MAKKQFQWVRGEEDEALEEGRGRSKRKRAADAVDELLDELLELGPSQWRSLPLSEETLDAMDRAREMRSKRSVKSGVRRQFKRTSLLLRAEDVDAIREALSPEGGSAQDRALRAAEHWRTRLLGGGDDVLSELLEAHPEGDRQRLRQLIRQGRKGAEGELNRAAKELFKQLRALLGS